MMTPSVELEAPSHAAGVLKELYIMQSEESLCDVRLTTQVGGVCAHRLVLMTMSPFMRSSLTAGDQELIYFDNIPLSLLQTVVRFMYTGKLTVESCSIYQLLKFCEDIQLQGAVNLLKDYIKNVVSGANQRLENDNKIEGDAADSQSKSAADSQSKSSQNETDKSVKHAKSNKSDTAKKKSNRRVKQTPKKRAAKEPIDVSQDIPDKLVKLSSDVLAEKVLTDHLIKEEPVELPRGRGRPRRNTLKAPTSTAKRKAPKIKYVSKKAKKTKTQKTEFKHESDKEKANINESDEEKANINYERGKSARTELNSLKAVIKADTSKLNELKEPKKEITSDDEQNQTEIASAETDSESTEDKKPEKEGKPPKKRIWKKRKKQPCSMCDKVLSTKKRLVFHEYSQHGLEYDKTKYKMFHCPVEGCNHVSSSRNNMRTHTRSRHATERPHICEFCGKSFKLQNVLATHLNLHTGAKVFECKKCGERFNQHSGLDVHIKRHHMGETSWGELCHLCSEKFIQKSELSWHLFRVHNQPLPDRYKAYTCDKCNFVTKSCQDFERHKNAHAGIKEWICNICSKGCATKSELKRHVMYHGEKNFKCTFENCTYACVDDLGLQKHIQLMHTHRHFKPYVCSICKYKTGVKGNLDKHIRQVHNLEVVSKHTVPLKVKYKDFQQGDIITKDGKLVVSVEDRKSLYKEELMLLQATLKENGDRDRDIKVEKSPRSTSRNKTLSDQGSSSVKSDIDFSNQQQTDKYQENHGFPETNSFQLNSGPVLESITYSHPVTMAPHMNLESGQALRMGLGTNLGNPHLFTEGLQVYCPADSLEHVDIMNK